MELDKIMIELSSITEEYQIKYEGEVLTPFILNSDPYNQKYILYIKRSGSNCIESKFVLYFENSQTE